MVEKGAQMGCSYLLFTASPCTAASVPYLCTSNPSCVGSTPISFADTICSIRISLSAASSLSTFPTSFINAATSSLSAFATNTTPFILTNSLLKFLTTLSLAITPTIHNLRPHQSHQALDLRTQYRSRHSSLGLMLKEIHKKPHSTDVCCGEGQKASEEGVEDVLW